jgi:hypothetical protein
MKARACPDMPAKLSGNIAEPRFSRPGDVSRFQQDSALR